MFRLAALAALAVLLATPVAATTTRFDYTGADFLGPNEDSPLPYLDRDLGNQLLPHNSTVNVLVEFRGIDGLAGGFDLVEVHGIYYGAFYDDDINNDLNYNDAWLPAYSCQTPACLVASGPQRYSTVLTGDKVYASAAQCYVANTVGPSCIVSLDLREIYLYFTAEHLAPDARLRVTFSDAPIAPSLPVPEPASWSLAILGFFGLGAVLRRRSAAVARAG